MTSLSSRLLMGFTAALVMLSASFARAEDLECNTRLPAHDNPDWSCIKASSYEGRCVPASDFAAWKCLELDADATFCDDDQAFHTTVYLTTNGVGLDCNGQRIEHATNEQNKDRPGIRAAYANSIRDVDIRHCNIRNTGSYGIDLRRFFRGAELDAPLVGHENVRIHDVNIAHTARIGIYVGQNSMQVTIDHVTIDDANMGVYLGNTSTHTRMSYVTVKNSHDREAIAIDSSQHNLIEHSVFHNNRGGGIKLYKNCGEVDGQACPIRRALSASYNTLRFNELYGEGIEVASRQFKLYGPDHCIGIDVAGFWRDHADHNLLVGNYVENGVIDIQDTDNTVFANVLESSTIEVGKPAPLGDVPFDIDGIIAENELGEHSTIRFTALPRRFDALELFNNHESDGSCWDGNTCRGQRILLRAEMVSAGLLAVLF